MEFLIKIPRYLCLTIFLMLLTIYYATIFRIITKFTFSAITFACN
uniref:Uncharacterized protein n=1 Tax=CrAss-like virus sp. ctYsL76 TaxID=2826826 RepID=A0A8S5QMU3_9CAUD|nr:MAG TPA: hypothetical protein [CrAss-like virus sp. ctYsL76]